MPAPSELPEGDPSQTPASPDELDEVSNPENILADLNRLIARRLAERRESGEAPREVEATSSVSFLAELARLREALRQDEQFREEQRGKTAATGAQPEPETPMAEVVEPEPEPTVEAAEPEPEPKPTEAPQPEAEPETEERASSAEPPPRGALSEGLKMLFGRPAEVAPAPPGVAAEPGLTAEPVPPGEETPYYRSYLRELAQLPRPLATGFPQLDQLLGGGLRPGLYILAGAVQSGARAFMQNALWKGASEEISSVYFSLATGSQRTWEELIATLSHLLGDQPLRLEDLLDAQFARERREEIRLLDQALGRTLLPYLRLIETLPGGGIPATSFLRYVDEALAPAGRRPSLVLVDGLQQLAIMLALPNRLAVGALLRELDALLRARGVTGLMLSEWSGRGRGRSDEQGLNHLGSGLLSFRRRSLGGRRRRPPSLQPSEVAELAEIVLAVEKQPRSNRQGQTRLILELASGLLVEVTKPAR